MLGQNLSKYLEGKGQDTLSTFLSHPIEKGLKLDIFKNPIQGLERSGFVPDIIVNTVALTNVDYCERDHSLADLLNVESAKVARVISNHYGCEKLVHISTDQVHNGISGNFKEDESPTPINYYGVSKVKSEDCVLSEKNSLVCRVNFYGPGSDWRQSFSDWIIKNLQQQNSIPLFCDSIFNPLSTYQLSSSIFDLVNIGVTGLFHICGEDVLSKYDFAMKIAEMYDLNKHLIRRSSLSNTKLMAPRPRNMSLNIEKVKGVLSRSPGGCKEGIKGLFETY